MSKLNQIQVSGTTYDLEDSDAAKKNGYYSTLGAGVADNLAGRGTVEASYTRRTSGGSADIGSGTAQIKSIHGNTIVWNQLVQNGNFADTSGWASALSRGTLTASNNVLTYTASEVSTGVQTRIYQSINNLFQGHKYLISGMIKTPYTSAYIGLMGGSPTYSTTITVTANIWNTISIIQTFETTENKNFAIGAVISAIGDTYDVKNCVTFDLTAMFGSGNEPSTVAEFKALFPLDYYAYNAGQLLSFNGTGIKTDGFNQLDSDGHIKVFAGQTYHIEGTYTSLVDSAGTAVTVSNSEFTPSKNDTYTMVGGSCVHLKWSGYRNGDTEEYWNDTLSLPISTYFANGMRRAGSIYDELTPSKAITRIGVVDLGTLTWEYQSSYPRFRATKPSDCKNALSATTVANILCPKYNADDINDTQTVDKSIAIGSTTNYVYIHDSAYTDATTFKNSLSGVYLFYELATPTEQTISTALALSYRVDDFGTETLLPENDDEPTTAPIIYDVQYAMNAVDTIRRLSQNYIGKDSWDTFVTAMAAKGFTITTTWDSTNSKYNITVAYDRVPAPPSEDGDYVLMCTVSSGTATFTWQSA